MKVLAISPHTDDVEFGAGATVASFVREGAQVVVVALSACERSVPSGLPSDVLRREFRAACDALGVADARVLDFDVRTMPEHRQEILETLLRLRRDEAPDLVLVPSLSDTHQDHAAVAAEAVRAFRGITTLGYVLPWNCPTVRVSAWRRVYAADVARKIAALRCYASQASRPYATEDTVRAHLVIGGVQAGCQYAEPYDVIRYVL